MTRYLPPLACIGLAAALAACTQPPAPVAAVAPPAPPKPAVVAPPPPQPAPAPQPAVEAVAASETGLASWYRTGRHLHRTYSGQMLNNNALTAASPSLPMGTKVRVERQDGSRSVVVVVNDRMPPNHRLIDLSELAARELGMMGSGVTPVTVTPIVVAYAP